MLQINIVNNITGQPFSGNFSDQASVDAWISENVASSSWGKPTRTVTALPDGTVLGEDVSKAISSKVVVTTPEQTVTNADGSVSTVPAITETQYTFPADYTISAPIDITSQLTAQTLIQHGLRAQTFGATLIAHAWMINQRSELSTEQVTAFMSNPIVQSIISLWTTGSIQTAYSAIVAYNSTLLNFWTQDSIDEIVNAITSSEFYTA